MITIVVQVNGKLRANLTVSKLVSLASQDEIALLAAKDVKVASFLAGKELVKTVVVPGKLVNFVTKG